MSFWRTLTGRLFKLVFGWYLALAIVVTSVQLMLEYASIKDDISANLGSLGQSFAPGVADALWAFDRPQLEIMASGIVRAAYVTGVRIESENGRAMASAGEVPPGDSDPGQGLFAPYQRRQFALDIRTPRGEQRVVGQLVLFSDRSVAVDRIEYSFFVIVINSLIKTTGLWLIFYLVITRSLAQPLTALTEVVSRIEFAADGGGAGRVDYAHQDELGRLLHATDKMQERVAAAQQQVAERTRELAAALEAARAANRLKSAFLANVSHELRTPLNLILGYAQIMERSRTVGEEERGYAKEINQSGRQLLALINDVIEVSRVEAGLAAPTSTAFDLPELLGAVRMRAAASAQERSLEVGMTVAPEVPRMVIGDPGKLQQALLNLLSAGIQRGGHGCIDVAVSALAAKRGFRLQIDVHDVGNAIPAEELAAVFEPFSAARHGSLEGSGLELAVAREYATLLGGTLTAENAAGQGALFRLTVPLEPAGPDRPGNPATTAAA